MKRLLMVFAGALLLFVVLAAGGELIPASRFAWLPQAYLKTALILVSCVAIAVDRGRGFGAYGFRKPERARWFLITGSGLLLGMITTSAIVLTPAEGMKMFFEGYGFLDIVIWIWIWSSISEEIFIRGWFQTVAASVSDDVKIAEVSSALLYGVMHLSLLVAGADPVTVLIIVTATTILGFLAARFRTATSSVYPPIATHICFNVGIAIAGIAFVILSVATDGAIPHP